MTAPDHTHRWDPPTVAHRYLFDCGRTMDVITTQMDGSVPRGAALEEAARVWGKDKDRRIVGATTLAAPPPAEPDISGQLTLTT